MSDDPLALLRRVLDAQQSLHGARFALYLTHRFFPTDVPLLDYRGCRWGIDEGTLYVARPLELAEETHPLCADGFDLKADVYEMPATDITVVRVLLGDGVYLFTRSRRDDDYFRGECAVLYLCDARGDFVKHLYFAPSLLTQRKPHWNHPFTHALRRATGLASLDVKVATLQAIAARSLAFRALVCEYHDGEVSSAPDPDLYVVPPGNSAADCACEVVSFGGRVLDPRALPGLAASRNDVTLTTQDG